MFTPLVHHTAPDVTRSTCQECVRKTFMSSLSKHNINNSKTWSPRPPSCWRYTHDGQHHPTQPTQPTLQNELQQHAPMAISHQHMNQTTSRLFNAMTLLKKNIQINMKLRGTL